MRRSPRRVLLTGFTPPSLTMPATADRVLSRALLCRLALAAGLALLAPAAAGQVFCPDSMNMQLEMVTFYDGPPEEDASLVYDELVEGKDATTATWNLPQSGKGYWVKCRYRGTTLELSKQLPASVSVCRVIYERNSKLPSGLPAIRSIDCH